jgi:hypothetical protein
MTKDLSLEIRDKPHHAMRSPFSFQEFEYCRRKLTSSGKSPGPSALTTTQTKHWGPATAELVYQLSSVMWAQNHVPEWWQDRLMTLLPKELGAHNFNKVRPISLFEVIRKMWAGMVTTRVQRIWHAHGLLHPQQHGFRMQHGTHKAFLQVLNHLEQRSDALDFLGCLRLCTKTTSAIGMASLRPLGRRLRMAPQS